VNSVESLLKRTSAAAPRDWWNRSGRERRASRGVDRRPHPTARRREARAAVQPAAPRSGAIRCSGSASISQTAA